MGRQVQDDLSDLCQQLPGRTYCIGRECWHHAYSTGESGRRSKWMVSIHPGIDGRECSVYYGETRIAALNAATEAICVYILDRATMPTDRFGRPEVSDQLTNSE